MRTDYPSIYKHILWLLTLSSLCSCVESARDAKERKAIEQSTQELIRNIVESTKTTVRFDRLEPDVVLRLPFKASKDGTVLSSLFPTKLQQGDVVTHVRLRDDGWAVIALQRGGKELKEVVFMRVSPPPR